MKFTITIDINESKPEVFRYLTSPTKLTEWTKGLQSIKPVKGRRSKEGGTSKLFFKEQKTTFTVHEEVLIFDRNNQFKIHLDHQEMITDIDYYFRTKDHQTVIVAKYHIRFKNILNRALGIFFKGPMKKQQLDDLKKLKSNIE
jgi:hypothetical protein